MTTRTNGSANIDDIVTYEDRANAPQSFVVQSKVGDDYGLVSVSTGLHSWSDLRQYGWTTTGTRHTHDLGITISAGDVPADQIADLVSRLLAASYAMVEAFNATGDIHVDAYLSYDGRRDCDKPHPIAQPVDR